MINHVQLPCEILTVNTLSIKVKKNVYGGGGDGGEMLLINKYS